MHDIIRVLTVKVGFSIATGVDESAAASSARTEAAAKSDATRAYFMVDQRASPHELLQRIGIEGRKGRRRSFDEV